MKNGVVVRLVVCGGLGIAAVGCVRAMRETGWGAGIAQSPTELELKDISPAAGSSVPNAAIVQRFTIVGQHL